jgi:hypothetical protein
MSKISKAIPARWNSELITAIASRCTDRRDFRLTFPSAYGYASRKGMLPAIYRTTRLPHAAGTLERLMGEA